MYSVLIFKNILHLKECRWVILYDKLFILYWLEYSSLVLNSPRVPFTTTPSPIPGSLVCCQIKSSSCRWSLRTLFYRSLKSLFSMFVLLLIEGQKKRRNTLHEFKKSAKTTLFKEDPLLKIKTKKMNTADQCANRCVRNKGLPFTCK